MQKTSCLRNHHRCDELNEFWLRLQFVKFEGRLRPFVKLMKTVSNSFNSSNSCVPSVASERLRVGDQRSGIQRSSALFKLKGGKLGF